MSSINFSNAPKELPMVHLFTSATSSNVTSGWLAFLPPGKPIRGLPCWIYYSNIIEYKVVIHAFPELEYGCKVPLIGLVEFMSREAAYSDNIF